MHILSYHVYDATTRTWLEDDEAHWTSYFSHAASFNDSDIAKDIGEREGNEASVIYVFACLSS